MMETLFRLMLARAAVEQSEDAASIRLSQTSAMQAELGKVQDSSDPREASKAVARQFVTSSQYVSHPKQLNHHHALQQLRNKLDELESQEKVEHSDVVQTIEQEFGMEMSNVVKEGKFLSDMANLRDSILAIKLLPEEHKRPIEELTKLLRDLEFIVKVSEEKDFPDSGQAIRRYRRRSLILPTDTDLRSSLSTMEKLKELERQRREAEKKKREEAQGKLNLYQRLEQAIKELVQLDGEYFQSTEDEEDEGYTIPDHYTSENISYRELDKFQKYGDKALSLTEEMIVKNQMAEQTFQYMNLLQNGSPAKKLLSLTGFRLKSSVEKVLSKSTLEILEQRNLKLTERNIDQVVDLLRQEMNELGEELDGLYGRAVKHNFKRMGNTMVMVKTPVANEWNQIRYGEHAALVNMYNLLDFRIPRTHGSVTPAGVADLLVVKQQLLRYEGADVAHIENILKGEKKEREHTRRSESEQLFFSETEVSVTEERELESTDRFEMSRETNETIKEESSLKAGLNLSGKYGPVVEFAVSVEGSLSRSKEEAVKAAATFSQEVTQKSASKIAERVLERSSLRVVNEVIESNKHTIDNSTKEDHVAGVYQWVHKVYQAQMFNYGLRTLYDFMIPEPAAFIIEAMQHAHMQTVEIEKPMTFNLRPDQINESNYHVWVKEYGATDILPPPEMYLTKTLDFKAGGGDSKTNYSHSGQISIDEGYRALHGYVAVVCTIWDNKFSVDMALGNKVRRYKNGGTWVWSISLNDERGSVPFALTTFKVAQIAAAVEVKCVRTERAMMKWRLDTHAKLTQAYQAKMSEYEEKLAALEMQAGVAITGKNPELNKQIMKDELKKNCVSILTNQHFDMFDAIATGSNGLPQINLYENAAEGPYVRFFEQAFEWEHMTWITYPYFWGRKEMWEERITYEDTDPLFNDFLRAGYCRVTVPARRGFEGAIDHFMTFGEVWQGGPLPAISSDMYLPIADELAERLDRPQDEIPEGDPWTVRIPTNLVLLRKDDQLPRWIQNEDGEWVEA